MYMYVCIYVFICVYIHMHAYMYLSAYLSIHMSLQPTDFIFTFVYACVSVSICHVYAHAYLSQEKAVGPLELEFQIIVSFPMWVLETEFFSNRRETSLK